MSRRERQEDGEEEDHDMDTAHARAMVMQQTSGPPMTARIANIMRSENAATDDDETYDEDDDEEGEQEVDKDEEEAYEEDTSSDFDRPMLMDYVPLERVFSRASMRAVQNLNTPTDPDTTSLAHARTFAHFYTASALNMYPDRMRIAGRATREDCSMYVWPYLWHAPPDISPLYSTRDLFPSAMLHEQLVYTQWTDARLPIESTEMWRDMENMVRRNINAADWDKTVAELKRFRDWSDDGDSSDVGDGDYLASSLIDVASYTNAVAQAEATRTALVGQVRLGASPRPVYYYSGSFRGVGGYRPYEERVTPLERYYRSEPVSALDLHLDELALSRDRPNSQTSYYEFMGTYRPVEERRQAHVAAINKMLVTGLMETAILFGPSMATTRRAFENIERPTALTFIEYWAYGTVWLDVAGQFGTGQSRDGLQDLIEFRRHSNWIIADNWRRRRLAALYKMYTSTQNPRPGGRPPVVAALNSLQGSPVLRLSPSGRAAFCALLPFTWSESARYASAHVRTSLQADNYRPVPGHISTHDVEEDVVYNDKDRSGSAATKSELAIRAASSLCNIINLQAAMATYGCTPVYYEHGAEVVTQSRSPIDYETVMAQVFGTEILDVRREYGETVEDTVLPGVSQNELIDFVEGVREVMKFLTMNSVEGDTYGQAMYRIMFGTERFVWGPNPAEALDTYKGPITYTELFNLFQ